MFNIVDKLITNGDNEDQDAILEINGYGLEYTIGKLDDKEDFDAIFLAATKDLDALIYDGLLSDGSDITLTDYNDIFNAWGIEGKDISDMDISLKNKKEEVGLDKNKIHLCKVSSPDITTMASDDTIGFIRCLNYEKRLTTQYYVPEDSMENIEKMHFVFVQIELNNDIFVIINVLILSESEMQDFEKNTKKTENILLSYDKYQNIITSFQSSILDEGDFVGGSPTGSEIALFNKIGKQFPQF